VKLKSALFALELDPVQGSLRSLRRPGDPHRMNWILDAAENSWHAASSSWGLGWHGRKYGKLERWQRPLSVVRSSQSVLIRYRTASLDIAVRRTLTRAGLQESYRFTNRLKSPLSGLELGLYAPFNDNYPDAETCQTRRCHAHVWCGGASSWVSALRMDGDGPHLGLVLTQGELESYAIEGREDLFNISNVRGQIVLRPPTLDLKPGQSYTLAWRLFWHQGWEDFFAQAQALSPLVRIEAEAATVHPGEKLKLRFSAARSLAKATLRVNGRAVKLKEGTATVSPDKSGPLDLELQQGAKTSRARFFCAEDPDQLIAQRTRFIVRRQQLLRPGHPKHGALLAYDNQTEALWEHDQPLDWNEGRERMGMGVLLAQQLQRRPDKKTEAALKLYLKFVKKKLQAADGRVFEGIHDRSLRLYNFPFCARLHFEAWRLWGKREHLLDCYRTYRAYYRLGGVRFYAFVIQAEDLVKALRQEGLQREAALILTDFKAHAERMLANGTAYPFHEVRYEQSIVAPAALLLLDLFHLTGEARYRSAAALHLKLLEPFNGMQPDHRMREIAMRHWDGYWFGRDRLWGDTLPHYWSTLTALAFHSWARAGGGRVYAERAKECLRNNLCLFTPEGRASCAYVYPSLSNGREAARFDPLANDQDWALVYYLDVLG
jgi:hypothetical protein